MIDRRALLALTLALPLAACGGGRRHSRDRDDDQPAGNTPEMQRLIRRYADAYNMPESLIHRVVRRESNYNPGARNGPYWGLMQIRVETARTMGYRGPAEGLLDAETNLKYAGKYLRGAWLVSRRNQDRAVMWYSKGYYYEAKRLGLLEETGLRG